MGIGSAVSSIGVCFELLGYLDLIQKNDFFAHLAWMTQGKYFKRKTVIQCTPHRLHNMVGKTEVKHDCVILFTPEGTFTFEGLSKRSTGFSDFWKASPSNPVHVFFQRAASTTNSVKIFLFFLLYYLLWKDFLVSYPPRSMSPTNQWFGWPCWSLLKWQGLVSRRCFVSAVMPAVIPSTQPSDGVVVAGGRGRCQIKHDRCNLSRYLPRFPVKCCAVLRTPSLFRDAHAEKDTHTHTVEWKYNLS